MSGTSFIVEVPTLFTKSTQMAMRSGNTILTGNERIDGNMVINGSLTLDGTIDDTLIQFDDFDISSLNVYENTTLNTLRVTSTLEVEGSSTLNGTLSVVGHSFMTGLSCDDLEVSEGALLNNVQVSGTMNLANGIVDDLLCQQHLEVIGVASFLGVSMESLDVSGHSLLESISCETLEVLGDLSVNYAFLNDVSCLQLDISNTLNVVGEAIFRDISVGDLSCHTLDVRGRSLFQDAISYQVIDDNSVLSDNSAVVWIVAGESVSRINESHSITLSDIREGNIFGKPFWAPRSDGYVSVGTDISSAEWALSLAFGVVNPYKSGTLFYQDDTSHNVALDGPNLLVNKDSSGLIIPSFSVLTVNHFDSSYAVYINGIQEYTSANVNTSDTSTNEMYFIKDALGVQLLAGALWEKTLTESQIEQLTLEALTATSLG